jgi:hypothetical protein
VARQKRPSRATVVWDGRKRTTAEPSPSLVKILEIALAMARDGKIVYAKISHEAEEGWPYKEV